jgi:hypothetical protein
MIRRKKSVPKNISIIKFGKVEQTNVQVSKIRIGGGFGGFGVDQDADNDIDIDVHLH